MRTFRVRYLKIGGHIHCRVFSAENPSGTFMRLGVLVMDEKDWDSFRDQIGSGWQLLPEERLEDERATV